MASGVRTSRTRGGLSGLMLAALGAWGGVAPFIGPSIRFGFTPDQAWHYTPGRLYLSAIPGAVVLLTGIVVLVTRSRWLGGLCAFLAALGGAWFITGSALVTLLPANVSAASASTGHPLAAGAANAVLTSLAFYAGTGALIVFFAALALGRFSVAAYRDHLRAELEQELDLSPAAAYPAEQYVPAQFPPQYPPEPDPFPSTHPYPDEGFLPTGQFPAQYPATETLPGSTDPL